MLKDIKTAYRIHEMPFTLKKVRALQSSVQEKSH